YDAVRKADPTALVLGDRLPIYWDEDALRAVGSHVDVLSVNYDVATPGGWVAPYFFEGLRDLVPAPVLVSEWFFASRENRTGNANRGQLMTVATQAERARGAAAAARRFAGFPNVVVSSGVLLLDSALAVMDSIKTAGDSDIFWKWATWSRERLAFQDTTFVTASGDREWIAFGEGGTGGGQAGRITLWDASETKIHRRLQVTDLVNNASERVTALDLNRDGTFGAARGDFGSYYWKGDLRLLGSVPTDPGGAGAALHPNHPSFAPGMASSERTLSFVGQGDYTVRILDTVHFTERGQLHIRDLIVGPLRAGPPLPTDNGGVGNACVGADCVVVKLYAVTDAGGVVVVDVRRRDIANLQ
ncbi:MAG: hypothetical protein MUO50_03745, partial [Longimicrobiales bacterium]|nr:hypothetical protein [Longimicrobiales bacterium]